MFEIYVKPTFGVSFSLKLRSQLLIVYFFAVSVSFNSFLTDDAFVDSVDQDQTAQNVQSELGSTLSTFFILDYN